MNGLRWRILGPPLLISFSLAALGALVAVSLFRQQADTSGVLRENVASRRAATELEECLYDLVALLRDRVESVSALHERAATHLDAIRRHAGEPEERQLSARLDAAFAAYLACWKTMPERGRAGHEEAVAEATRILEADLLKPCLELEQHNNRRIEESTAQHDRLLQHMSWGMAGVSVLGGVAGLFLGFGVSRSLSQSIQRLRVQIRDAAGKLGRDFPEIVLTGEGEFSSLHEQVDRLSVEIEGVVQRLRQREHEVLRADQLAAVGQLAAGVAHEIRNPLTSIKMLVQAGLEDGGDGLASEDLRVIEDEVRRLERSLQAFLNFARPPKPQRRPVDVAAVARAVFSLVRGRADKQQVEMRLEAPARGATITADGEQLQQVLVNLVLNALDAMPTGGTLTVAVRPVATGGVVLEIADTGTGIASEVLPRLFQPFVSGKDTGLGLGLVTSRRVVEDHGGGITGENRPEGGAVFFVALPPGPNHGAKGGADVRPAGRR